jgi:DNA-binding transcriptional LysR family regulator
MLFETGTRPAAGIDARLLRYFLVLAEELHFTRAAQRLDVSQPALSNQIKRLETHLGAVVFIRTTRGVSMSPAGVAFLPYARQALSALQMGAAQAVAAADAAPVPRPRVR